MGILFRRLIEKASLDSLDLIVPIDGGCNRRFESSCLGHFGCAKESVYQRLDKPPACYVHSMGEKPSSI
jgi:hypothetical protein